MPIDHLLDHTCRIWRPTTTLDQYRAESRAYAVVAEGVPCRPRRAGSVGAAGAPLADTGPGLFPVGSRVIYMTPERDVQLRDVIELSTGPDTAAFAPGTGAFEVESPPTRPGGNHIEIRCRHFAGTLAVGS